MLRLTYDREADAAYVYLAQIEPGAVKKTIPWGQEPGKELFLDFDEEGKLVGMEILDASKILSKRTLESAT